jgi:glycosyltransferase involved in cell wall biosynthesis
MSLNNAGFEVVLIVNDSLGDEIIEGIKILSTNYSPNNRLLRFIKSGPKLYEKAVEVDADIYHLHDPDLLFIGNKLKRLGKKVIFDSHEDYPSDIANKEWIPYILREFVSKIYELYEKHSIKNYDAVISVSPQIVERLKVINQNTHMITNYPILKNKEYLNTNYRKMDNNYICFAGAIHKDWGHHIVMDAISKIDNIKYILAGPSSVSYFSELKTKKSWDKVDYRGVVTSSEVHRIYKESKIGIAIHYSNSLAGKGTLGNTKLFEFMEAGLPLICSDYPLWDAIIKKHHCGISIDPRNENEVREAIEYIINNPNEADFMGKNGINAVINEYNWGTQEFVLIKIYKDVLSKSH